MAPFWYRLQVRGVTRTFPTFENFQYEFRNLGALESLHSFCDLGPRRGEWGSDPILETEEYEEYELQRAMNTTYYLTFSLWYMTEFGGQVVRAITSKSGTSDFVILESGTNLPSGEIWHVRKSSKCPRAAETILPLLPVLDTVQIEMLYKKVKVMLPFGSGASQDTILQELGVYGSVVSVDKIADRCYLAEMGWWNMCPVEHFRKYTEMKKMDKKMIIDVAGLGMSGEKWLLKFGK